MISLEDFQEYMSQHGKSVNTIHTYLGHVKGYALWYEETYGHEMTKLYHTNILDYRSYLQNIKRLKFNSINAKLSALSCFNHFLIETADQDEEAVVSEDRLKFQQMIASPSDLEKPEVDEFLQRVLVETKCCIRKRKMALFLDDVDHIPDLDTHIHGNIFPIKKVDAIHCYITSLLDSNVRCCSASGVWKETWLLTLL